MMGYDILIVGAAAVGALLIVLALAGLLAAAGGSAQPGSANGR
jgi:hypothetical protein